MILAPECVLALRNEQYIWAGMPLPNNSACILYITNIIRVFRWSSQFLDIWCDWNFLCVLHSPNRTIYPETGKIRKKSFCGTPYCISNKSKFGANFWGANIASVLFKLLFASLQTMSQNTKLDFQLWFIWHNLNSFEKVPDITFYRLKLSALISSSRKIAFPPNLISSYYNFHGMYQIRITNPSWWTIICVCHLPLQWNCMYFPTSETHLSLYPGPVCLVL